MDKQNNHMAEKYNPRLFQRKYTVKCNKIGEPLSEKQTRALEDTITDFFGSGVSKASEVSETLKGPINKQLKKYVDNTLSIKAFNALKDYVYNTRCSRYPTNGDALEFYNIMDNPKTAKECKIKYKLAGFGKKGLLDLRKYLKEDVGVL